jgi:hypothetical protein
MRPWPLSKGDSITPASSQRHKLAVPYLKRDREFFYAQAFAIVNYKTMSDWLVQPAYKAAFL